MSFSIGRAGLTLALPEPLHWQNSGGGTVTLTGTFLVSGSVTDSLRLRDQLLGYAGNFDEPIVPVISGAQPRDTGYYRVVSVDIPTTADSLLSGIHAYGIVLQPVPGYAQPQFESIITGALLNNAVGAVTGDMTFFHAVPLVSTEYFNGSVPTLGSTRSTADGILFLTFLGTVSGTAHFYLTPANFYVGAGLFEQGSPLQPVVGRQLVQNDLVNWRLSNGLVRVTPNATAGKIDVSHWKGAAWAAAKTYQFSGTLNAGLLNGFSTVTVMRNSPEETIIRLSCTTGYGVGWGRVLLDLALRRGDRLVRGVISSDNTDTWKVSRTTAEAATAITYGAVTLNNMRATANDVDGNRYVLISDQAAATNDLVNGALTLTAAAKTMDFGIGSEIGGSAANFPDRAVDIAQQYLAVQGEKQQTVAR